MCILMLYSLLQLSHSVREITFTNNWSHAAPTQESSNQAVVIISSSVTVITLIVLSIIVVIVTIVIVKRCGRSKVVLQVTGDSMDIVGDPSLPSVLIHKWVGITKIIGCLGDFPYNCKSCVILYCSYKIGLVYCASKFMTL